jgi:glutathione S-transferase
MNSFFQGSTLFISARSPFARRVRIALHESRVEFQERVFDVFQPNPELWNANPLARVPSLVMQNGHILIDSTLILQAFYENGGSPFMPKDTAKRYEVYRWSAIALGLCEKAVEYYLETLRPKENQDSELFAEIEGIFLRSLAAADTEMAHSESGYLVENAGEPSQADFDWGSALAYLKLRHPLGWQEKFPALAKYLDRLNARPSFKKTAPPPA